MYLFLHELSSPSLSWENDYISRFWCTLTRRSAIWCPCSKKRGGWRTPSSWWPATTEGVLPRVEATTRSGASSTRTGKEETRYGGKNTHNPPPLLRKKTRCSHAWFLYWVRTNGFSRNFRKSFPGESSSLSPGWWDVSIFFYPRAEVEVACCSSQPTLLNFESLLFIISVQRFFFSFFPLPYSRVIVIYY